MVVRTIDEFCLFGRARAHRDNYLRTRTFKMPVLPANEARRCFGRHIYLIIVSINREHYDCVQRLNIILKNDITMVPDGHDVAERGVCLKPQQNHGYP